MIANGGNLKENERKPFDWDSLRLNTYMDNLICAKCKNPMEMTVKYVDDIHSKNNKTLFNYFASITCRGCSLHYNAEAMDADEAIRKVFDVKKSVEESDPNG